MEKYLYKELGPNYTSTYPASSMMRHLLSHRNGPFNFNQWKLVNKESNHNLISTISPSFSSVCGRASWPLTKTSFPSKPILWAASAAVLPDLILTISPWGQRMITTSPRGTEFGSPYEVVTFFLGPKVAPCRTCSSHWSIVLKRYTYYCKGAQSTSYKPYRKGNTH